MKKSTTITFLRSNYLLLSSLFILAILSSCTDQAEERRKKDMEDMNKYVQEHVNATDKYADEKWDDMEQAYNEKKAKLDKDMDKMNDEMKQKYNHAVAEWETYRLDYMARHEARKHEEARHQFKSTLFPAEISEDMSNITPQNIAMVYEHFVDVVVKNKDVYTKEEWEAVDNCWKALDDKHDLYDKEIPKPDGKRILTEKLKYESIKVVNKPFAKKS